MASRVKRRRYDNSNRLEHAASTRQRILQAAHTLFVRGGYAATTIQAIADEARVAVQTVYATFGSKAAILEFVFGAVIRGPATDVPLIEQTEWLAWRNEPDPVRKIELFARANRQVAERTAEIVAVVSAAAATSGDRAISRMWEKAERARYSDQQRLASSLAESGYLRRDLPAERAADITWTLAGPTPFNDLVGRRGWNADTYEIWLADQLRSALVGSTERSGAAISRRSGKP